MNIFSVFWILYLFYWLFFAKSYAYIFRIPYNLYQGTTNQKIDAMIFLLLFINT